ncbi:hypothetical protein BaRGS_00022712 [Batillaria attramentaria]|uniref:Uncharacterized protein n=1 Tax=Batillaria attramentaria TaxID=370345 RepID=A0ABD0KFZ9_9CAEN
MASTRRRFSVVLLWCLVTCFLINLTSLENDATKEKSTDTEEKLGELDLLMETILKKQMNGTAGWTKTSPATIEGLFPSEVHINFHGEPQVAALRSGPSHSVLDLTSLATLLTLTALVEATMIGGVKTLTSADVVSALEALQTFRSAEYEEDSALMTFWPGCKPKDTSCKLQTVSENAVKGGGSVKPYTILQTAVKDCKTCTGGKQSLANIKQNALCLEVFQTSLADYAKRYNFPPDITSSFANLALGALLKKGGKSYEAAFEVWENANRNFSSLTQHVSSFAYKPDSKNAKENIIDSRTYYNLAGFLSGDTASEKENSVELCTNWIPQSNDDGLLKYGGKVLPEFNSVDLFGTATFLHAVTISVLQKMTTADENLKNVYRSNLDLMKWILTNKQKDSTELMMTSHPSLYQFYWQLARIVFEMENARQQKLEAFKPLEEFYDDVNIFLRVNVTAAILTEVQDGGLNEQDGKPLAYVDDFLGTADVDAKGKPSGSDRLFSTATAINSLLSAWTVTTKDNKLKFLPGTPDDVILAVSRLVNYINLNFRKDGVSLMNAFHSTVNKHCENLPYWFPSNKALTTDGKDFTGNEPNPEVLFGMRGTVTAEQYQKMLTEPHFKFTLPKSMPGPNSSTAMFFFWSSTSYTQSVILLSLAQVASLVKEGYYTKGNQQAKPVK